MEIVEKCDLELNSNKLWWWWLKLSELHLVRKRISSGSPLVGTFGQKGDRQQYLKSRLKFYIFSTLTFGKKWMVQKAKQMTLGQTIYWVRWVSFMISWETHILIELERDQWYSLHRNCKHDSWDLQRNSKKDGAPPIHDVKKLSLVDQETVQWRHHPAMSTF